MNTLLKPFWAGTFVLFVLLFGGVSANENGIRLDAGSCHAFTVRSMPKEIASQNNLQESTVAKNVFGKGAIPVIPRSVLITVIAIGVVLLAGVIALNIWVINLLMAKKFLLGFGILAVELIATYFLYRKKRSRRRIKKQ